MSGHPELSDDDLDPSVEPDERAALAEVAALLIHERPAPRARFRGQLRVHLAELVAGRRLRARPNWLWARATTLAVSGTGLLALVAIGLGGRGPFAT